MSGNANSGAKNSRGNRPNFFTVDIAKIQRYIEGRKSGMSQVLAAKHAGVSKHWAERHDKELSAYVDRGWRPEDKKTGNDILPSVPIPYDALAEFPAEALDNFDLFRRRYFGRVPLPWHLEAQEIITTLMATEDREFLILNVPPGSGKSTLSHDLQAWLIAKNRRIRILQGSKSQKSATRFTNRLKRSLERSAPIEPSIEDIDRGMAVPATSTLWADYGPFKPDASGYDMWTRESFIVQQHDDIAIDEKEATVTSFGMDSHSLGMRVDLAIWDDLVDKETIRSEAAIENQREFLDAEAETRIDRGGLFVLIGQRLSPDDLYRYALDKIAANDEDLEDLDDDAYLVDLANQPKKYHHIIFPAHDETNCQKRHKPLDPAWPKGCLLDPQRVSWRDLRALKANSPSRYETVYQQKDMSADDTLVPRVWIDGGKEKDVEYPGCLDRDRGMWQVPEGFEPPFISVVTADPSPSKYWAVQWWLVHQKTKLCYLIATEKSRMEASDFLDALPNGQVVGLLNDWAGVAERLGIPLSHVVFEANAAQRFFLQFTWFKTWAASKRILVVPHTTAANKADPDIGVAMIRDSFKTGAVRIPYREDHRDKTRVYSLKFIEEITRYPKQVEDDQVMACWFLFHNLEKMLGRNPDAIPTSIEKMPSWASSAGGPMAAASGMVDLLGSR